VYSILFYLFIKVADQTIAAFFLITGHSFSILTSF